MKEVARLILDSLKRLVELKNWLAGSVGSRSWSLGRSVAGRARSRTAESCGGRESRESRVSCHRSSETRSRKLDKEDCSGVPGVLEREEVANRKVFLGRASAPPRGPARCLQASDHRLTHILASAMLAPCLSALRRGSRDTEACARDTLCWTCCPAAGRTLSPSPSFTSVLSAQH